MASDPDVKDLADEIEHNPRAFAVRFAELVADVSEVKTLVRRGAWLAATVLVGVIVDLALRLQEAGMNVDEAAPVEGAGWVADRVLGLFG